MDRQSTALMIAQGTPLDYVNGLGAYNCHQGVDMMLDLTRQVQLMSGKYFWLGVAIPDSAGINFAARQTKEFTLPVEPNSYLVSICGACIIAASTAQNRAMSINIMDKGSRTAIFSSQFAKSSHIAPIVTAGVANDTPSSPYYLLSPWTITKIGQLQIQITNLESVAATIQLLLNFAIPYNRDKYHHFAKGVNERLQVTQVFGTTPYDGKATRYIVEGQEG